MRSEAQAARADAPNGFSIAKRKAAARRRVLFTKQDLRWIRFEMYQMSRYNAAMTMVYHRTPAVVHIPRGLRVERFA